MQDVRTACIEFVSLAIQHESPAEKNPLQLAAELFSIAEEDGITAEQLAKWIRMHGNTNPHAFAEWCRQRRDPQLTPARCGHCGAAITSDAEARSHKCR